jgi:outer membrane protein TolC
VAPKPILDLGECHARALQTAPELAGAAADVQAGRLSVRIADTAILPTLRAEGGYLRSSVDRHGVPDFAANNGEDEYIARGVVRQPVYAGGVLTAARAKARSEAAATEETLATVRAQVLLATDRAYFTTLATRAKRTIAESALAVAIELLRAAHVRLENGQVASSDVAKLELEAANARTALSDADADAAIARNDLAILVGLPADGFDLQPLASGPGAPDKYPPEENLIAEALRRPDVRRLEADVRATEAAVGLAHGARLPQVSAEAAGGYDSLDFPDRRNVGWQAGVAVTAPLWDWSGLANRERMARFEVEKARKRLEAAQRAVCAEVGRRYLELKRARDRLLTSAAAQRLAKRNADITRQGYELGLLSSLELITAQRQATAARSEHSAATYDERVATSELDFAMGRLQ